jgi:hypothetical protein
VVAAAAAAVGRPVPPLQFAAHQAGLLEGDLPHFEAVHEARNVFVAALEFFDAAEYRWSQVFPAWNFHSCFAVETPREAYDDARERRYLAASGKPEGSPDAAGSDQAFGLFSDM